jgi:N-hydroxyarylamine O-acetyltransferase
MDASLYLARIGIAVPIKPDAQTLRELHRAHMQSVPFENLDIARNRPIRLTQQALWQKIVVEGRGGFCYELNGLFAWLLQAVGYEVTFLNARVYKPQGGLGIDFDHLALLVSVPNAEGRWLVDVGFGDSFLEPLQLEERGEQVQGLRAYRLEETPAGYTTWQRGYDGRWERQYFFDLQPRAFPGDYESACLYHQTSPHSSFTRRQIISRATPQGRVSLEERRLILTEQGQRREYPVANRQEYVRYLQQYFDITLSEEPL